MVPAFLVGLAAAVFLLISVGSCGETVESLTKKLSSPDSATRLRAARSLGEMGELAASAIPALIGLLDDRETVGAEGSQDVSYVARTALWRIGRPAIVPCIGSKGLPS